MSSPKRKARGSVNQQVKARLSAVRDFLAGRSGEAKLAGADDKSTREVVGAELLAAMAGRNNSEADREGVEPGDQTQEIRLEAANSEHDQGQSEPGDTGSGNNNYAQDRARELFLEHGYFDEAVENLRSAKSPAERAAAARALGLFGSQRGTPHLIAAMFDEDAGVRGAAEEALAQIGDPTVTEDSVDAMLKQERDEPSEVKLSQSFQSSEHTPVSDLSIASQTAMEVPRVVSEPVSTSEAQADDVVSTSTPIESEAELLEEETSIKAAIDQLVQQVTETNAAIKNAENEIRWRIERENKLRTEAAERRRQEEEARLRAAQEAEARRTQEEEAFAAEQSARAAAESEAQRQADEHTKLLLEAGRLRAAAEEIARKRIALENERQDALEAERRAELTRLRDSARSRHEAELARLATEEEALRTATNEVELQQANVRTAREHAAIEFKKLKEEQAAVEAEQRASAERLCREAEERNRQADEQLRAKLEELRQAGEGIAARRAEIDTERAKADAEAERLVEVLLRMRGAEEARNQAEQERSKREAEINEQLQTQRRLLEETQRRGEEEKARLEEEVRRQAEAEQKRLAELESIRSKAENESKLRSEKEQQILSQIDSLRIADAETRKRIADAEARRSSAEAAYRLVAEKVQRTEAEAHARAKEEERILAKLESERRTVAIEAQSRAEQEKRIKEEIEMFRRLEEQERPRIEEATLQLAAAEARLEERRERLRADEEARMSAEEALTAPAEIEDLPALPLQDEQSPHERPVQPAWPRMAPLVSEPSESATEAGERPLLDDIAGGEESFTPVPPAITTYLNSVDPYKRAAAVAELARSGSEDAFSLIVKCFDDHSPQVRNAAARAFRKLEPTRTVDLFNRSLENAPAERRRNIGSAIAGSGLAAEAIDKLVSENREDTYNALSILFVMAKTGEVAPLVNAIEGHESVQVRMAAIKLLTLTGQAELANSAAKRRLEKLPPELDHLS